MDLCSFSCDLECGHGSSFPAPSGFSTFENVSHSRFVAAHGEKAESQHIRYNPPVILRRGRRRTSRQQDGEDTRVCSMSHCLGTPTAHEEPALRASTSCRAFLDALFDHNPKFYVKKAWKDIRCKRAARVFSNSYRVGTTFMLAHLGYIH